MGKKRKGRRVRLTNRTCEEVSSKEMGEDRGQAYEWMKKTSVRKSPRKSSLEIVDMRKKNERQEVAKM
jgi:hypothetical protein